MADNDLKVILDFNGGHMKFSRDKFAKNAPKGIQRQMKEHLDCIDGKEVQFDGKFGKDGYIEQYFKNGQEYYLYPVSKSWCVE